MQKGSVLEEQGTPLISIIIPVFNVEKYIERCLQSVLKQDYKKIEVLLIDDGSQDQSGIICDQWAKRDLRFKVFHKVNGGLSDARNYGLDRCQGEYISFVDSDDYLETTCISYLFNLIQRSEQCKVSQANHAIVWKNKTEYYYTGEQDYILTGHDAADAVLFHDRVNVSAWGKLYHRSVFDDIRYPKGRLYEDTYIFADVLKKTQIYAYGHIPQYNYVKNNPSSIVNHSFTKRNLEYIDAAERMARVIQEQYPDLTSGCARVVNHARLSVLRYMNKCGVEYDQTKLNLRQVILEDAPLYIRHPQTPRRDKCAIALLKSGLKAFYAGWYIYNQIRHHV